jgi:hypothetical protein
MFAPMLALQGVGHAPTAIANDAPETWTLEYPRVIQPFIEDYRRCLTGQMRWVTGEANFEEQHRSDLPRCIEERETAQESSDAAVSGRGEYADYTPADMVEVFDHIGRIHIARGADLDGQFTYLMTRSEAARQDYDAERPPGLVLELHDASVVKARTDATAAAAEAAYEEREEERTGQPTEARSAQN